MKYSIPVVQVLLGLIFLFFGLNGFFGFLQAPLPPGAAGEFLGAMLTSHYTYMVSGVQVLAAVLLLINQFVPFALALLAAMLANILAFHVTMEPSGVPLAVVTTILWVILAWKFRACFRPLFVRKANPQSQTPG
ncbi:MAG TPA: hypothetical protein VFZ27_06920 [Terriglobia bacterium]|nr:hypothetical protein [Terriglobia bacterium]